MFFDVSSPVLMFESSEVGSFGDEQQVFSHVIQLFVSMFGSVCVLVCRTLEATLWVHGKVASQVVHVHRIIFVPLRRVFPPYERQGLDVVFSGPSFQFAFTAFALT